MLASSCAATESNRGSDSQVIGSLLRSAAGFPTSNSEFFTTMSAYDSALEEEIAMCMRSHGFVYVRNTHTNDSQIAYQGFDLSREQFANEFGFGIAKGTISGLSETTDETSKYLLSLSEDELIEYRKTLYGHDSDQVELESDGCYQRADATVSKPSWHVNLDWSYTVSDELTQRMYSDPKIVSIRQEWIECMAESGYQNLTSEEDLIDTLHNEMANLIHTLIPLSPRFDSGQEFLHSLSKESREMFDAFLSKELRLAVASYECNAEHESQVISISREIEESILESNPPLQIQSR